MRRVHDVRPCRMSCAFLFLAVLLTVLDSTVCELEFCDDPYKQFFTYSGIWKDIKVVKKFTSDNDYLGRNVAKFLEDYANHICSVVNPEALSFFRGQVAGCQNIEEIMALVEENRGFCSGNSLNARVKQSIIDRLYPIREGTFYECLRIGYNSPCYREAVDKLKENQLPVSSFRNETDKFFDSIWECEVNLFKSHSSSCPNWQLPLLLSLDEMTVPALFRVRLTDQQIAMLDLDKPVPTSTTPASARKQKKKKKKKTKKKMRMMEKKKGRKNKNVLKIKIGNSKITLGKPKKTKKLKIQISNRAKSGKKSG